MNDLDLLRTLDPAVSRTVDSHDPHHLAILERAMRDTGREVAPLTPRRPARRRARRLAVVGATAAAALVAGAALPGVLGGATGSLAWSASPAPVTATEAATLVDACTASLREAIGTAQDPAALPLGPTTALVEARGADGDLPTVLVHLEDGNHAYSCYFRDGEEMAASGALATASATEVTAPRDGVRAHLGAAVSTDRGSLREVSGEVGADVVGVTLRTAAAGEVVATVDGGYFTAWWPDAALEEAPDQALDAPEITGAVLALADGSTRSVTVGQMLERRA